MISSKNAFRKVYGCILYLWQRKRGDIWYYRGGLTLRLAFIRNLMTKSSARGIFASNNISLTMLWRSMCVGPFCLHFWTILVISKFNYIQCADGSRIRGYILGRSRWLFHSYRRPSHLVSDEGICHVSRHGTGKLSWCVLCTYLPEFVCNSFDPRMVFASRVWPIRMFL